MQKSESGTVRFTLSRTQVKTPQIIELFYFLVIRLEARWQFLLISRENLAAHRKHFESAERKGRGRRPATDDAATSDALALDVMLKGGEATAWGQSFTHFVSRWPDELAPVEGGPGTSRLPGASATSRSR